MAKLTHQQKLDALAYRFYQGAAWEPKAGDFYTTSRADLELYQVVSVEGGVVRTRFTEGSDAISEWPAEEFLTGGFGPKRVFVPEWVIRGNSPAVAAFLAIDAERRRQVDTERWTPAHDDEHGAGELADAAACYALHASMHSIPIVPKNLPGAIEALWPWDFHWWKPGDAKRDLEKAGALLAAEWERIDRLEKNAELPAKGNQP